MIQKENAFQSKAASAFRNVLGQKIGAEVGLQYSLAEKTGKPSVLLGLGVNPGSRYEPAPRYWMSGTFGSSNIQFQKSLWEICKSPNFYHVPLPEWWVGLREGNQTAKQVLAADTIYQNFTGKRKNQRNVNSCPQLLFRKKTSSMEKKGKKEKKGEKEKGKITKKGSKKKNISK